MTGTAPAAAVGNMLRLHLRFAKANPGRAGHTPALAVIGTVDDVRAALDGINAHGVMFDLPQPLKPIPALQALADQVGITTRHLDRQQLTNAVVDRLRLRRLPYLVASGLDTVTIRHPRAVAFHGLSVLQHVSDVTGCPLVYPIPTATIPIITSRINSVDLHHFRGVTTLLEHITDVA